MSLSPILIIAVVLMLTSSRAKVNGTAFVLGWLLGLAAALSGANPKNLPLAAAGAAAIAQTGISGVQQAIAYVVFAVIGTLGVGIPVGIYFALGERSQEMLARLKDWMTQHNAVQVLGEQGDEIDALRRPAQNSTSVFAARPSRPTVERYSPKFALVPECHVQCRSRAPRINGLAVTWHAAIVRE